MKNQNDNEIRIGILLNQLLEFIQLKVEKNNDMEEFMDILLKIFENKIFPV